MDPKDKLLACSEKQHPDFSFCRHSQWDLRVTTNVLAIPELAAKCNTTFTATTDTYPASALNLMSQSFYSRRVQTLVRKDGRLTPATLARPYEGSWADGDPFSVVWIDNDPRNPMSFPNWVKWSLTALVAFVTLAVAFVSIYSGTILQTQHDFDVSEEMIVLGIAEHIVLERKSAVNL